MTWLRMTGAGRSAMGWSRGTSAHNPARLAAADFANTRVTTFGASPPPPELGEGTGEGAVGGRYPRSYSSFQRACSSLAAASNSGSARRSSAVQAIAVETFSSCS